VDLLLALIPVIPLLYFALETSRLNKGRKDSVVLGALAFLATLSLWIPYMHRPRLAWDFPGQYVAAHVPLHSVHNHGLASNYWRQHLVPLGIDYCPPYLRPGAFAPVVRPLRYLSFWPAFWLWFVACGAAYVGFIALLYRRWGLPVSILPGFAAFTPAVYGTIQGQDIAAVSLVLGAGIALLSSGWPVLGGVLLGLCCYKFNLILLIPVALLVQKQWRGLLSFSATIVLAAAVSLAITPLGQYLSLLRSNWRLAANPQYEGLKLVLFASHGLQAYVPIALVLGILCACYMRCLSVEGSLALAIVAGLFLSPQSAWYDLTILLIPIAIMWRFSSARMQFAIFGLMCATPVWLLAGKFCEIAFAVLTLTATLKPSGLALARRKGWFGATAGPGTGGGLS
jgi:glycopeptide antibiotics resistance protein